MHVPLSTPVENTFSATMASRFVEVDEEFIKELRNTGENKNSKRSTDYWTNIFEQWAKTRGENEQLECATKYKSLTKPSIILPLM